jgi:hypothetical protein
MKPSVAVFDYLQEHMVTQRLLIIRSYKQLQCVIIQPSELRIACANLLYTTGMPFYTIKWLLVLFYASLMCEKHDKI